MILSLIITIINVIMEFLGGAGFSGSLIPGELPVTHLSSHEWTCASPYWSDEARVQNGEFSGTVKMDCRVLGSSGDGLIELRKHMISQVPVSVSRVSAGPVVSLYDGMPSNHYEVTLDIDADEEAVQLKGNTYIVTDGFTQLRNIFESTEAPKTGMARLLKSLRDEVKVVPDSQDGWYRVTFSYQSVISKPFLLSSGVFKRELKSQQEQRLIERRERVLNDIASNL